MTASMKFRETDIPGCLTICTKATRDARGMFSKPFSASAFAAQGLPADWRECFWNESARGVIRGFHFQLPPAEHDKLVICVNGEIHDVALDMRIGSPSYGRVHTANLCSTSSENAIYIPRGLAHAFQVLSESATVAYLVSSEHDVQADAGIRWDSVDVAWPLADPVLSERDRLFPAIDEFESPFRFVP
jgi:dTDP-4-dehydrorhamnose 3,5-epimerase